MATIEFYSGIADKANHAVRLMRKAQAKGARVAVVGDAAALRRLDADLWTADARDFVPHVRLEGARATPLNARMDRTPLWLVEDARLARRCQVLVNLGPDAVESLEGFERVIELVANDPDDRTAGRTRWRRYEAMGHTIRHTPMDNPGSPAPDGASHGDA